VSATSSACAQLPVTPTLVHKARTDVQMRVSYCWQHSECWRVCNELCIVTKNRTQWHSVCLFLTFWKVLCKRIGRTKLLSFIGYFGSPYHVSNLLSSAFILCCGSSNFCFHSKTVDVLFVFIFRMLPMRSVLISSLQNYQEAWICSDIKIKTYRTITLPVVLCRCETWSLT
jgi:hypothetical protein